MYDPHIDSAGKRFANAPLVLDLYYMLAAQGLDLEREILLGIGMSAFHRNAIVPRPMIAALLGAVLIPPMPTKLLDTLTNEPLQDPANQPESITISQTPVDIDQSTKIWSALQSPHRPCAFYLVTTVFLDTGDSYAAGKPVDEAHLFVGPNADPALPAPGAVPDAVIAKPLP
jgi:hypothetical protein